MAWGLIQIIERGFREVKKAKIFILYYIQILFILFIEEMQTILGWGFKNIMKF